MKKFVALPTKEKQLRRNEKMITFFGLYRVYKKIRTILCPYSLINLFKERHISSIISIWAS